MAKDSIENMQSSDNLNKKEQADAKNIDIEVVSINKDTTSAEQVSVGEPAVAVVQEEGRPSERREIVRSASLVMLGNLGSSIMGMVRQIVVASTGQVVFAPFLAALRPAQTFNDLLVNGSVSGALIPTFNDYAAPEKRDELRRIVFTLVNLILLITGIFAILYLFVSPHLVDFLAAGFNVSQKQLTLIYSQ